MTGHDGDDHEQVFDEERREYIEGKEALRTKLIERERRKRLEQKRKRAAMMRETRAKDDDDDKASLVDDDVLDNMELLAGGDGTVKGIAREREAIDPRSDQLMMQASVAGDNVPITVPWQNPSKFVLGSSSDDEEAHAFGSADIGFGMQGGDDEPKQGSHAAETSILSAPPDSLFLVQLPRVLPITRAAAAAQQVSGESSGRKAMDDDSSSDSSSSDGESKKRRRAKRKAKKEKKSSPSPSLSTTSSLSSSPTARPVACALEDIPEGHAGKMLVYKSGKMVLVLGDVRFNVLPGTKREVAQEVIAVNAKEDTYCRLGDLMPYPLVVTPDFQYLFNAADKEGQ
jgi:RNA polymerase III RPC4